MYFLRPPLTEAAHCYKNKPRAKPSHETEKTIKKDCLLYTSDAADEL